MLPGCAYVARMDEMVDGDLEGPWSIAAGPEDAGSRLDRFLAQRIGAMSRSRIKALIEAGHVTADGVTVTDPARAVAPAAHYGLRPPPTVGVAPRPQAIPFPILFEDRDLLVLDKPAGLVVHPAPGNEDGTLVNALLAHCGDALPGSAASGGRGSSTGSTRTRPV